jgi:hypothetical protein
VLNIIPDLNHLTHGLVAGIDMLMAGKGRRSNPEIAVRSYQV